MPASYHPLDGKCSARQQSRESLSESDGEVEDDSTWRLSRTSHVYESWRQRIGLLVCIQQLCACTCSFVYMQVIIGMAFSLLVFCFAALVALLHGQHDLETTPTSDERFPNLLSNAEVVITLKSGASVIHERLAVHFDNEFSLDSPLPRTSNLIVYSDYPDVIRGHTVVDALANVSNVIRSQAHFQPYFLQAERLAAGLKMDHLDGAWQLDKYKFMPMLRHAYTAYPDAKWYSECMLFETPFLG